jgi:hypothetical protein
MAMNAERNIGALGIVVQLSAAASEKDRLKALLMFFYDGDGHSDLWTLMDVGQSHAYAATPAITPSTTPHRIASTSAFPQSSPPSSSSSSARIIHSKLLRSTAMVRAMATLYCFVLLRRLFFY